MTQRTVVVCHAGRTWRKTNFGDIFDFQKANDCFMYFYRKQHSPYTRIWIEYLRNYIIKEIFKFPYSTIAKFVHNMRKMPFIRPRIDYYKIDENSILERKYLCCNVFGNIKFYAISYSCYSILLSLNNTEESYTFHLKEINSCIRDGFPENSTLE